MFQVNLLAQFSEPGIALINVPINLVDVLEPSWEHTPEDVVPSSMYPTYFRYWLQELKCMPGRSYAIFIYDYTMPILGNLCFIPFISILLEIFVCDHSIGNDWSDSYLSVDCYQFCWQGSHLTFAILSALSLALYEPFAVFCRPLWQEFEHTLHVKSIPLYLMIKTIIQVIIIVLNKTLKRSSDTAHGFIFLLVILFYLAFGWKFKAYNYGRFNWWHQLSLVGVAWVSCLSTIYFLIEGSSFPWVSLIIGGWTIIILMGLIVQKKKYPNLLFRKKGKDTSSLFKFAFTFGKKSKRFHSKIEPQTLDLFKSECK